MKIHIGWKVIKQIFAAAFSAIGGVWTVLEIVPVIPFQQSFIDKVSQNTFPILVFAGAAGGVGRLIYFIWHGCFRTFYKEDRTIRVRIGNILNQKGGNIVVGVNEELTTNEYQIGQSSIHRQILKRFHYASEESRIQNLFEEQRENRAKENSGTEIFQITLRDKQIMFLPMSNLNKNQVVTTTLEMVRKGLVDLFRMQGQLKIENQTVFVPLLGTGEAGIHLSKEDTVKMIVRTFVICCGEMDQNSVDKIKHLNIIVHPKDCMEIDWARLNEEIAFILNSCDKCTN